MTPPFFPDLAFGWAFVLILGAVLAVASWMDLRFTVIPKWLTLAALPLGIGLNVTRAYWLASQGKATWYFTDAGAALGALDGFLFSAAGFFLGFFLFTAMWLLGVCGGGDVKLFAVLGAWIGPRLSIYVLAVTLIILSVLVLAQAVVAVFTGKMNRVRGRHPKAGKATRRLVTFALPLTVATALVAGWVWRHELNLVPPPAVAQIAGVQYAR